MEFFAYFVVVVQRRTRHVQSQHFVFKVVQHLFGQFLHLLTGRTHRRFQFRIHVENGQLPRCVFFAAFHHFGEFLVVPLQHVGTGTMETVERSSLDEVFYHALVEEGVASFKQIRHVGELAVGFTLVHKLFDDGDAYVADASQTETQRPVFHTEHVPALVDAGWQNGNALRFGVLHVLFDLRNIVDTVVQKCANKLRRIVVFEPCRLVGYVGVAGGVRLVECVLRKVVQLLVDFQRRFFGNTVVDATGHRFAVVPGASVYKQFAKFTHHVRLFLAHGVADVVGKRSGKSRKFLHQLHYLFLIHNATVGYRQNAFHCRVQVVNF